MRQKIVIIVNIHAEGDIENQYKKATGRLLDIQQEMTDLSGLMKKEKREYRSSSKMVSNMTKEEFCANVEKCERVHKKRRYIPSCAFTEIYG